jgi:Uri superfamily endonuclease
MAARVARHLSRDKTLHWHIDYLLGAPAARIVGVRRSRACECAVNRSTGGVIVVPGFGATDCRAGCTSHLKYAGRAVPAGFAAPTAARSW